MSTKCISEVTFGSKTVSSIAPVSNCTSGNAHLKPVRIAPEGFFASFFSFE